jgi:PhnB protein
MADQRDLEITELRGRVTQLEQILGRKSLELETINLRPAACPELVAKIHANEAAEAIDFYADAFGAKERFRVEEPDGRIAHAALQIGTSMLFVGSEYPEVDQHAGVAMNLYVGDVDSTLQRVRRTRARVAQQPEETFWGDVATTVEDPFGNSWRLATLVEGLSEQQIVRRAERQFTSRR